MKAVRVFFTVVLLGGSITLGSLAHAIPTDPTWIAGLYDAADYDDIVLAATGKESLLEGALPADARTLLSLVGVVRVSDNGDIALGPVVAFASRAPPIA